MFKMSNESKRLYGVSGNLDQIQRTPELAKIEFQAIGPRMPNRAVAHFADKHAAAELYKAMRDLKLVALKDWID